MLSLHSLLQYPVLSLFSMPRPILFSVSLPLFSAPQSPPHPHPRPRPLQKPYVFPVSLSSSVLRSSRCLCWQRGRRRRSEASCISYMHYSCALQSVWVLVFCWLLLVHMCCVKDLCVWDTGPDGRAAKTRLSIP